MLALIDDILIYGFCKSSQRNRCQQLWDLLNARLKCSEYKNGQEYVAKGKTCVIIGAGPIGLRTSIEMLMLGCRTIVVEKRRDFTRNNVLHLWPFLMTDFRQLGAKKFYGKFGAGSIDHISKYTLFAELSLYVCIVCHKPCKLSSCLCDSILV